MLLMLKRAIDFKVFSLFYFVCYCDQMCFVAFYPVRAVHLFAMKLALKKYDPWYVESQYNFVSSLM